jgi:ATP-binding cassette subfamily C (CFTR/MRP) protein 1
LSGISDTEPRFTSYKKSRDLNPNPFLKAGIFSRIFFVWLIGLIYKGYKNPLEGNDVYELLPDQKANEVYGSFHKELKKGLISFDSKNIDKFIR